jgi:hypothetical protein
MVTDMRRATVQGVRDTSGPVTFALGMVVVIVGIAGVLALHPMAPGLLRLTVGTAVVSAAILGPRPARVTATGAGLILLALGVAGLAGVTQAGSDGAEPAVSLVLGIALAVAGRR